MNQTKHVLREKATAFICHLALSITTLACLFLILKQLWYPGFFFDIDGGIEGLEIVFFVDVVIGPLLTFTVYKKGKKGLKMDLTLIVIAQVLCMGWGVLQTWKERPLVAVLTGDTFRTMNASALAFHQISPDELASFPGDHPKIVFVPPSSEEASSKQKLKNIFTLGPLYARHKLYQPIEKAKQHLMEFGYASIADAKAGTRHSLSGIQGNQPVFLRIEGKFSSGFLEVDPQTGNLKSFYPN